MAPSGPAAAKAKPAAKADAKAKAKSEPKKKEEPRPEDLIEKVNMPNKEEFEEKLAAVQADVDKLQKQQQDLAKRISERSGGKDEYQTKRAELRAELDHWSGLLDGCRAQKEEISKSLGDQKAQGMEQRSELNKMKKSIGFTSETEIDEEIQRIEFKMPQLHVTEGREEVHGRN
jgi:chromosome segregation ATPase